MPVSIHPRPFYVPTIDLSSYLTNSSSSEAEEVIQNVREACLSTGFFQLINHGLEKSLQSDVFDAAEKFFKLPFEEKMKLNAKTHKGHRGYDVLASQSYEEHVMPDLKEVKIHSGLIPLHVTSLRRQRLKVRCKNRLRMVTTLSRVSILAPTSPPTTHVPFPAASLWVPMSGPRKPTSP